MNVQFIRLAVLTLLTATVLHAANEPSTATTNSAPADTGTVVVTIGGLQSTQGLLYASLYISGEGFPSVLDQAFANQAVTATEADNGTLILTFEKIPAGAIAISVFHDANSDGKLDTNFLGIPTENYGFSQNPPSRFGPPSFDKAATTLSGGETQQLVITLK